MPAWELPKSPLDPLFRKGYGGLGQSALQEVIDLLTPSKKVARRSQDELAEAEAEEEGESDYEMVNMENASNASSQVVADDPAEQTLVETSTTDSMQNNMNTYSMDNSYHYDHKTLLLAKQDGTDVAEVEEVEEVEEFVGIEDLPELSQRELRGSSNAATASEREERERDDDMFKRFAVETVNIRMNNYRIDAKAGSTKGDADKVVASKLSQKAHSRDELLGGKKKRGKIIPAESHTAAILDLGEVEVPLPENHPVDKFGADHPIFPKSGALNDMIKKSFESFLKQYAPKMTVEQYEEMVRDGKKKGDGKSGKSKESKVRSKLLQPKKSKPVSNIEDNGVIIYDLHDQKIYQYDVSETLDNEVLGTESLDTQDYYNYVSSHSNSPKKDKADLLRFTESANAPKKRVSSGTKAATSKKRNTKRSEEVTKIAKEETLAPAPVSVPAVNNAPVQAKKKTVRRPSKELKARSSSDSKLLEPTAASKNKTRK
ncbi:hypothetical protein EON64_12715 [archaeon]|nr:MAG: hypothetical protein EON64_12715 [archaeon]